MKAFTYVTSLFLGLVFINAQGIGQDTRSTSWKFSLGLDFAYLNSDLNLASMSQQSYWEGQDLGVVELEGNVIDTINTFTDHNRKAIAFCVAAGVNYQKDPESKWKFGMQALIGIVNKDYIVKNTLLDTTDLRVGPNIVAPIVGIRLNALYQFTSHWGLELRPTIVYSWSKSDKITDNLYGKIDYFDESRTDKTNLVYFRSTIMANYSYKRLKISVGPGFYGLTDQHEYTIERINPETGKTYLDIINTRLHADSFVDGCIGLEWMIKDYLSFSVFGAFGKSIMIQSGLVYLF